MLLFFLIAALVVGGFLFWWFKSSPSKQDPPSSASSHLEEYQKIPDKKVNLKPDFFPSPTWEGKREGYLFKRGEKGQGYYKDEKHVRFDRTQILSYDTKESPMETGNRIPR